MSENADNGALAALRKKIDEIDDGIIRLLLERIGVVEQVGELKRKAGSFCPIRPGREATQLRRIMQQCEQAGRKDVLLPAAAAAIWRTIIGLSTSIETPLKISAFTPIGDNDLFWLAREYFGPFVPVIRQPQIKRVIGDVMDGKAGVGILPVMRSTDPTNWWINLMEEGENVPKIFARIPFVNTDRPGKDAPSGLAVARIMPEASGDDVSLWVIEADHNVSQNRLQGAFTAAKLETQWITVSALSQITRHHLIEIKGFVSPADEGMQSLLSGLGKAVVNIGFLGAYAVPVLLGASETKSHSHAVGEKERKKDAGVY